MIIKSLFHIIWITLLTIAISGCTRHAKTQSILNTKGLPHEQLAQTPPMGWSSKICYGSTVTEAEVKANADYMAQHLKKDGWEYIVVDIRWYVENEKTDQYNQIDPQYTMDEFGRFLPSTSRFPSAINNQGFKPLANYIHNLGLKFGIQIMRGVPVIAVNQNLPIKGSDKLTSDIYSTEDQCSWLKDMYTIVYDQPGAQDYYNSIFELYASWGVDYVEVDDLSYPYHEKEIELIRKAINECGRPMVLSTSPGATPLDKAEHIVNQANLWRICDDINDEWKALEPLFELCNQWSPYVGAGHWPNAGILPLGRIAIRGEQGADRMSKFTLTEQYTLMNLWAISRSPLIIGGDLPSNDAFTLALITNQDILEVNQNSSNNRLLKQGNDGSTIWIADIPNTHHKYLAFFNKSHQSTLKMSVLLNKLGISGSYSIKNLWSKFSEVKSDSIFQVEIIPHGSQLFRIEQIQ